MWDPGLVDDERPSGFSRLGYRVSPFLAPDHQDFPPFMGTEFDTSGLQEYLPRAAPPFSSAPMPALRPVEYRNVPPMVLSTGDLMKKEPQAAPAPVADNKEKRPRSQSRKRPKPAEDELESGDGDNALGGDDTMDAKRKQRLLRNRASAQLSRERKKAYLTGVEQQVERLTQENARLMARIQELTAENLALRNNTEPIGRLSPAGPSDAVFTWSPQLGAPSHNHTSDSDQSRDSSRSPSPFKTGGMFFFSFLFALVLFFNVSGRSGSDGDVATNNGRALMSLTQQQTFAQPHPSFFASKATSQQQPDIDLAYVPPPARADASAKWDPSALQVERYNRMPLHEKNRDVLLLAYRKMLQESFLAPDVPASRANASYFFVPSVFSILNGKDGRTKAGVWAQTQRSDNLLPSGRDQSFADPNVSNASDMPEYIVQGDMVYFWLPLSMSSWAAQGESSNGGDFNQSLFEIGCNVHAVRILPT